MKKAITIATIIGSFFFSNCSLIPRANPTQLEQAMEIHNTQLEEAIIDTSEIIINEPTKDELLLNAKATYEQAAVYFSLGDDEKAKFFYDESIKLILEADVSADEYNQLPQFFDAMTALENLRLEDPFLNGNENGIEVTEEDIAALRETQAIEMDYSDLFLKKVFKYEKKFTEEPKYRKWVEEVIPRTGIYLPYAKEKLREKKLDEDLAYLLVIESGLLEKIISRANAKGIAQFTNGTGKKYGLDYYGIWFDDKFDPVKSINAYVDYLVNLIDMFPNDDRMGEAAYNRGENGTIRSMILGKYIDFDELLLAVDEKRDLTVPSETINHVLQIHAIKDVLNNLDKYDFKSTPKEPGFILQNIMDGNFDIIIVDQETDLEVIANIIDSKERILKQYNPSIQQWMTPPKKMYERRGEEYAFEMRVPKGTGEIYLEKIVDVEERRIKKKDKIHRVRSGETVSRIAKKYEVPESWIVSANNMKNRHKLSIGQRLVIPAYAKSLETISKLRPAVLEPTEEDTSRFTKIEYKIRRGNTLDGIRNKLNIEYNLKNKTGEISRKDLRDWNAIKRGQEKNIRAGQTLKIYIPKEVYNKK